jgi:hypothetical protein
MIDFKEWLVESTKEVNGWQFVFSAHAFDRLRQRTAATFDDESTILQNISRKLSGLRFGEYGFSSKKFNKIVIAEVNPTKKTVKLITVLNGDMRLKQGTPKIITESISIIDIDDI